jgi:chitin synthase
MQFVVGMELASTVVLPVTITFTTFLILSSVIPGHTNTAIPLIILAIILGLPGLLIVIPRAKLRTSARWSSTSSCFVHAYWHFDDPTWGQTQVSRDKGGRHEDNEGEFDSTNIVMKR